MELSALISRIDQFALAISGPVLVWILLSGVDDLFIYYTLFLSRFQKRREPPTLAELKSRQERRIAIFVPLWKEHPVVRQMVEHNIASIKYSSYDIFIGGYPNDPRTIEAIKGVEARFENVHLARVPHPGPTSKADCLNWVFQAMLDYEENQQVHFKTIIIHDAEDLIHPEELLWLNWHGDKDMVQIPVLALKTPLFEFTHGVYCDEFVEFQSRDLPVRELLGGFLPSSGVGTGFSRRILEKLAVGNQNRVFEPACLTEDYENGFRIKEAGGTQVFLPIYQRDGAPIATREFFPRSFSSAVKQRTRWVTGIALQGWERHGWRGGPRQWYWHWRDRKTLVGNPLSVVANLLFVYGLARLLGGVNVASRAAWWVQTAAPLAVLLNIIQIGLRIGLVKPYYGWAHALTVPLRIPFANLINALATLQALRRYAYSHLRHEPLVWLKTEHVYPDRASLVGHRPKLGEVLVRSNYIEQHELTQALDSQPAGVRIGEYLIQLGMLKEDLLYEALSLQQSIPLTFIEPGQVSRRVARCLPNSVLKHWRVVPYKIESGNIFLAGPDIPAPHMNASLRQFTRLEIRFHLVTPSNFARLERTLLETKS